MSDELRPDNIKKGRGYHVRWTPEMDAFLGKIADTDIARRLGCSVKSVRDRRIKLGIPSNWSNREIRSDVIVISPESVTKIEELAPLLSDELVSSGVPVRSLSAAQVVEIAVHRLLEQIRRDRTRAAYRTQKK